MAMLLGHAYLTAAEMTMRPFLRLNRLLAAGLVLRALTVGVAAPLMDRAHPVPYLWDIHGLYIFTRVLVGLVVPGVFVFMTDDCIRRRATQSATGILYVTTVLIFAGELMALHLVRGTGLPW